MLPKLIGHRGAKGEAPENTVEGIRFALDLGVDGIEIDVHRTLDGHLVLMHDPHVERTTDGNGLISEMTLAQIMELDAGEGTRVPTLEEALAVTGDTELFIEVKCTGVEQQVLDTVTTHGNKERTIIKSFDHAIVKKMKELDLSMRTACILEGVPVDPAAVARAAGADVFSISTYMLRPDVAELCRAAGLQSFVWSAETPETYRQVAAMGFDYICTSFPRRILGAC